MNNRSQIRRAVDRFLLWALPIIGLVIILEIGGLLLMQAKMLNVSKEMDGISREIPQIREQVDKLTKQVQHLTQETQQDAFDK